jgi:hypothetical protein
VCCCLLTCCCLFRLLFIALSVRRSQAHPTSGKSFAAQAGPGSPCWLSGWFGSLRLPFRCLVHVSSGYCPVVCSSPRVAQAAQFTSPLSVQGPGLLTGCRSGRLFLQLPSAPGAVCLAVCSCSCPSLPVQLPVQLLSSGRSVQLFRLTCCRSFSCLPGAACLLLPAPARCPSQPRHAAQVAVVQLSAVALRCCLFIVTVLLSAHCLGGILPLKPLIFRPLIPSLINLPCPQPDGSVGAARWLVIAV